MTEQELYEKMVNLAPIKHKGLILDYLKSKGVKFWIERWGEIENGNVGIKGHDYSSPEGFALGRERAERLMESRSEAGWTCTFKNISDTEYEYSTEGVVTRVWLEEGGILE